MNITKGMSLTLEDCPRMKSKQRAAVHKTAAHAFEGATPNTPAQILAGISKTLEGQEAPAATPEHNPGPYCEINMEHTPGGQA